MINSVRNTVLSILNKNNYGYISPSDFNLFAKQAQLDLFEDYFYGYNSQISKENVRRSGTGYADITKGIEEAIDVFSVTNALTANDLNQYYLPSITTTGDDYYLINKCLLFSSTLTTGTTDGISGGNNRIVDSTKDFTALGVEVGDYAAIQLGNQVLFLRILGIVGTTNLTVNTTGITTSGHTYSIYKKTTAQNEAEKVSNSKITMLNNSLLTAPSLQFPAYTQEGSYLYIYPDTTYNVGQVVLQYIRYPKDPKWTYVSIGAGEPVFDQSQPDYQDFELPLEDESALVVKILQYAGVSIREAEVVQFSAGQEALNNQKEQQ